MADQATVKFGNFRQTQPKEPRTGAKQPPTTVWTLNSGDQLVVVLRITRVENEVRVIVESEHLQQSLF